MGDWRLEKLQRVSYVEPSWQLVLRRADRVACLEFDARSNTWWVSKQSGGMWINSEPLGTLREAMDYGERYCDSK